MIWSWGGPINVINRRPINGHITRPEGVSLDPIFREQRRFEAESNEDFSIGIMLFLLRPEKAIHDLELQTIL